MLSPGTFAFTPVRLIFAVLLLILPKGVAQEPAQAGPRTSVTLSGIVLTSDHRCATTGRQDQLCRESDWALSTGRKTYLLFGNPSALKAVERKRVTLTGELREEPVVDNGVTLVKRSIRVESIGRSKVSDNEIERLVQQLKVVPWRGAENAWNPTNWDFAFTDPMLRILEAGSDAENVLLRHVADQDIEDQIVILLGGVGTEAAIPAIIDTMTDGEKSTNRGSRAGRQNLIADLALTNLTVAEVNWHHGGGITIDKCPLSAKTCWLSWWFEHRETFKAGVGGDRNYSNYPNYGIYAQFGNANIP